MPKTYSFHSGGCPKCGHLHQDVLGEPSFVVTMCPDCLTIYVLRTTADGQVISKEANQYQVNAYLSKHPEIRASYEASHHSTFIE